MVQPRTVVDDPRNSRAIALNFMIVRNNAEERIALITNLFVIKTNAFFAAIASVLVMKFKALEQLIACKIIST